MTTQVGNNIFRMNAKRSKTFVDQSTVAVNRSERIYFREAQHRSIQGARRSKENVLTEMKKEFNSKDTSLHRGSHYIPLNYGTSIQFDPVRNLPEVKDKTSTSLKKARKGPRGGVAKPFPVKLHQLLERKELCEIISWQPHGRCFILRKPKEFLEIVMPRYFRQSKITSFQRQLNLYGFHRLTSGPDKGGYYHERFLRGKPALCEGMLRVRIKGKGSKSPGNPEAEPNFYNMRSIDFNAPSITKEKQFKGPILHYRQDCTSPGNGYKNNVDQESSRNKEEIISSPICVSSMACFESVPYMPPLSRVCASSSIPDNIYSNSVHQMNMKQNYKLCSPSEATMSGVASHPDSLTFEGKEFHYINSDSIFINEEHNLSYPDRKYPNVPPALNTNNTRQDTKTTCADPLLEFEW